MALVAPRDTPRGGNSAWEQDGAAHTSGSCVAPYSSSAASTSASSSSSSGEQRTGSCVAFGQNTTSGNSFGGQSVQQNAKGSIFGGGFLGFGGGAGNQHPSVFNPAHNSQPAFGSVKRGNGHQEVPGVFLHKRAKFGF